MANKTSKGLRESLKEENARLHSALDSANSKIEEVLGNYKYVSDKIRTMTVERLATAKKHRQALSKLRKSNLLAFNKSKKIASNLQDIATDLKFDISKVRDELKKADQNVVDCTVAYNNAEQAIDKIRVERTELTDMLTKYTYASLGERITYLFTGKLN